MLHVKVVTWILYMFSAQANGWYPVYGEHEFKSWGACNRALVHTQGQLAPFAAHARGIELRCRTEGWDGKDANAVSL